MLCQSCGKNDAVIFLKAAVNNKVTGIHLCGHCAEEKGVTFSGLDAEPLNLSGMPGHFGGYFKEFLPREKRTLRCRTCGQAYHEFKESGLLGCPGCYAEFAPQLTELLTRIHGSCAHTGKQYAVTGKPPAARPRESAAGLREALKKAVAREDFEAAARLRDRIKELGGANG